MISNAFLSVVSCVFSSPNLPLSPSFSSCLYPFFFFLFPVSPRLVRDLWFSPPRELPWHKKKKGLTC
ncbi:hypothetical protein LINPERHAP1_LOCUS19328 [Linum perenne]